MKVYVNEKNEIKDVNTTSDTTLTELEILDENNPFSNWSIAKICCYKVKVNNGHVTMLTPYVDSRIIEHIDSLGQGNETNASDILDTQLATAENYESILNTEDAITNIELALTEIYESILGGI